MSLRILYLYSLLIPEVVAVLPFPLLDFYVPLNDEVECMDYSTDCDAKKGLCKNEAFKDIMYSKCAKTCQICGEIIKDDDPVFNVNIQEHLRPDSDQNWKYPRMDTEQSYSNEGYEEVQSYRGQQGPHRGRSGYRGPSDNYVGPPDTYGGHSDEIQSEELDEQAMKHMILRPPPTAPVKPKMRRVIKNCVDIAPNCFYLKSLCFNRFYLPVMQNNCKKTCGFCGAQPVQTRQPPPSHRWKPNPGIQRPPFEADVCKNRGLDCDEKLHLCTHWRYWKLMRRICALSCGFCDPDDYYNKK